MSRIDDIFTALKSRREKALMPFITAGDPDLDFTRELLLELDQRGANLIEVGIPYSDPIADGKVIQESYTRALANRVTLEEIFQMLASVTPELSAAVLTMVSYAIVYRHGTSEFIAAAQRAGVSGAIIPDMPVEECERFAAACAAADFSLVLLATPTTPQRRAEQIARQTTGFLYYVSVTGITGERTQLPEDLAERVRRLRDSASVPICIGFGISTPEHVKAIAPFADGLIVGSAIVRRVAAAAERPRDEVRAEVGGFVASLKAALPAP